MQVYAKSSFKIVHCLAFIPTRKKKKEPESALPPPKIEKEANDIKTVKCLSSIKLAPRPAGHLRHGSGQ